MTEQQVNNLFETARALADIDPHGALEMMIGAHSQANEAKASSRSEIAKINSQVRVLGARLKKAQSAEAEADAIIEKTGFLIKTLEGRL